jgi:hypothetical protein
MGGLPRVVAMSNETTTTVTESDCRPDVGVDCTRQRSAGGPPPVGRRPQQCPPRHSLLTYLRYVDGVVPISFHTHLRGTTRRPALKTGASC